MVNLLNMQKKPIPKKPNSMGLSIANQNRPKPILRPPGLTSPRLKTPIPKPGLPLMPGAMKPPVQLPGDDKLYRGQPGANPNVPPGGFGPGKGMIQLDPREWNGGFGGDDKLYRGQPGANPNVPPPTGQVNSPKITPYGQGGDDKLYQAVPGANPNVPPPTGQVNSAKIMPYGQPTNYATTASTPTAPKPNTNVQAALNGMTAAMKREIERKAKAGEPLAQTTEAKRWLYNFYKGQGTGTTTAPPSPTAPTAPPKSTATATAPTAPPTTQNIQTEVNAMTPAMKREIERKAKAGEPLDAPTAGKQWLYDSFKPQGAPNPTPVTAPNVAPPVNNGEANWNSNQSIPDFGAMTPEMIDALQNGYLNNPAYDPATDPAYQATLAIANKQADAAGLSTMEDMNERGILNSTVTSDRVGQIKQGASDAVIGNIPGFQANYNNNHQANMNGLSNLLNTTIGASQFQQTHAEGNRRYDKDFSLDEAQVTGSYMPAGAQSIINSVMNAKQANSQPGLSAAQRAKNAEIANTGRQQLAAMGIDVSGIAGDVTYDSAVKNLPGLGRNTIIQQQTDLDKTEVMGREVNSQAQSLVQTILKAKGDNEKGIGNKVANARIANEARAQLAALGFDVSGIGGNVKYDQAVKNAANITGKNTLSRDSLNNDARQDNADRALDREGLQLDRDKLNAETALGNRELTFREEEAKIRADLDSRGLDLDSIRNDIDWFAAESDAAYKDRQELNDITTQEAQTNTNRAIGNIAGATSAAEAWAYISSQTQAWADSGVDFSAVVDALESRFPGSTSSSEADGSVEDMFGGTP